MAPNKNIIFEIERTLRNINSQTLALFRERKFPVSKEQWSVLERISKEEGSNQKDIAKDTFKDPAALTRMLDLLAEKGFVQREASKNDRRTFDVHLTVEGSRLVNRMSLTLDNFHSTIEKPLTISDKNSLITILLKLN